MAWGLVDDDFHGHPKVVALLEEKEGGNAIALWTLALSWARAYKTHGRIPRVQAGRLIAGGEMLAELLRKHGLWDRNANGDAYQFHDWSHIYRQPAEEAARSAELSIKRADAGRKGAMARWHGKASDMAICDELASTQNGPTPDPAPICDRETAPVPISARIPDAFAMRAREGLGAKLQREWSNQTGVLVATGFDQMADLICQLASARGVEPDALLAPVVAACARLARSYSAGRPLALAPIKFVADDKWAAVQQILNDDWRDVAETKRATTEIGFVDYAKPKEPKP